MVVEAMGGSSGIVDTITGDVGGKHVLQKHKEHRSRLNSRRRHPIRFREKKFWTPGHWQNYKKWRRHGGLMPKWIAPRYLSKRFERERISEYSEERKKSDDGHADEMDIFDMYEKIFKEKQRESSKTIGIDDRETFVADAPEMKQKSLVGSAIDELHQMKKAVQGDEIPQPQRPMRLRVALVGLPNAGKSTLVNNMVGSRVSIVTPKAQTTRERIVGVWTEGDTQVIFYDTPGILLQHKGKEFKTARSLLVAARNALAEADMVLTVVDNRGFDFTEEILKQIANQGSMRSFQKFVLVVNKIDLMRYGKGKEVLRDIYLDLNQYQGRDDISSFADTFEVSATLGKGVGQLKDYLFQHAVPGEWLYHPTQSTDQTVLKVVEEVIREQLFFNLDRELPYKVWQRNQYHRVLKDGRLEIAQDIMVRSKSQRVIVVGKNGYRVQNIASAAELTLYEVLGVEVKLRINVKVATRSEFEKQRKSTAHMLFK